MCPTYFAYTAITHWNVRIHLYWLQWFGDRFGISRQSQCSSNAYSACTRNHWHFQNTPHRTSTESDLKASKGFTKLIYISYGLTKYQSITLTSNSPICRKKNHGSRKNSPNRPIICRTNFSPYVIKKSPHFKEIRPFFSSVSSQIPVASTAICQSDWLPVWNRSTIASQ